MAAEAQNATLEFILVNHPLDCPVCDKGGECPLQDLTFRYGPGNTRMTFPKRTWRSRSRSRRRSPSTASAASSATAAPASREDVAEDGQLVARDRGAHSIIATFEDEPYRATFSGNVIELCPVGALTSTQYRFEARPWEIQNVPSVCGLCPVGCNITATTREGKVKRILSRNHPEIDEGWLCDKGRFAYAHLYARDRVSDPLRGSASAASRSSPGTTRSTRPSGCCARRPGAARALRLGDGRAGGGARALVRQGLGSDAVVLPEQASPALDALPRAALVDPRRRAVIVSRRRPGRGTRAGRRALDQGGPAERRGDRHRRRRRTVRLPPGDAAEAVRALGDQARERGADLVGPGGAGGATVAALAAELGAASAFYLPATPNGRAVVEAWRRRRGRAAAAGEDRHAARLRRRGRGRPARPRARRAGRRRDRDRDVRRAACAAGPTSSCRRRATSSATGRWSTSRAARSACAAR